MKKWKTGVLLAALAAVMSCTALAAEVSPSVYADPVIVDGHDVVCINEGGAKAPCLRLNGTTYIPIRTAGEWMGKQVGWDGASKTVTLSGEAVRLFRDKDDYIDAPNEAPQKGFAVRAETRPDFSVVVDGQKRQFRNVQDAVVYPLLYNGVTYLPLRNIGELTGMEVTWWTDVDRLHECIYLRTPLTDAQDAACKTYLNALLTENQKLRQSAAALRTGDTVQDMRSSAAQTDDALAALGKVSVPADIPMLAVQSDKLAQNLAAVQTELNAATAALQKGDETEARRHLDRDFQLAVQAAENNIVTMKRYYLQKPTDANLL